MEQRTFLGEIDTEAVATNQRPPKQSHYMALERNKENSNINFVKNRSADHPHERKSSGFTVKRNKCFSPNSPNFDQTHQLS